MKPLTAATPFRAPLFSILSAKDSISAVPRQAFGFASLRIVRWNTKWRGPQPGSHNGWLVLDRNGNGIIDDFGELFGDQTPQPTPLAGQQRNGFAALSVYDTPEQGGNGDGWISKQDSIFDSLRVWVDENHDGISQPSELHTLDSLDIAAIRLKYDLSEATDSNGNVFRFRSTIRDSAGGEVGKVIFDVLLQLGSSRQDAETASWFAVPAEVGFTVDQ
jgi:hypothetical protein